MADTASTPDPTETEIRTLLRISPDADLAAHLTDAQRAYGLPITGEADAATVELLRSL